MLQRNVSPAQSGEYGYYYKGAIFFYTVLQNKCQLRFLPVGRDPTGWNEVKSTIKPCARSCHSLVILDDAVFIYGGVGLSSLGTDQKAQEPEGVEDGNNTSGSSSSSSLLLRDAWIARFTNFNVGKPSSSHNTANLWLKWEPVVHKNLNIPRSHHACCVASTSSAFGAKSPPSSVKSGKERRSPSPAGGISNAGSGLFVHGGYINKAGVSMSDAEYELSCSLFFVFIESSTPTCDFLMKTPSAFVEHQIIIDGHFLVLFGGKQLHQDGTVSIANTEVGLMDLTTMQYQVVLEEQPEGFTPGYYYAYDEATHRLWWCGPRNDVQSCQILSDDGNSSMDEEEERCWEHVDVQQLTETPSPSSARPVVVRHGRRFILLGAPGCDEKCLSFSFEDGLWRSTRIEPKLHVVGTHTNDDSDEGGGVGETKKIPKKPAQQVPSTARGGRPTAAFLPRLKVATATSGSAQHGGSKGAAQTSRCAKTQPPTASNSYCNNLVHVSPPTILPKAEARYQTLLNHHVCSTLLHGSGDLSSIFHFDEFPVLEELVKATATPTSTKSGNTLNLIGPALTESSMVAVSNVVSSSPCITSLNISGHQFDEVSTDLLLALAHNSAHLQKITMENTTFSRQGVAQELQMYCERNREMITFHSKQKKEDRKRRILAKKKERREAEAPRLAFFAKQRHQLEGSEGSERVYFDQIYFRRIVVLEEKLSFSCMMTNAESEKTDIKKKEEHQARIDEEQKNFIAGEVQAREQNEAVELQRRQRIKRSFAVEYNLISKTLFERARALAKERETVDKNARMAFHRLKRQEEESWQHIMNDSVASERTCDEILRERNRQIRLERERLEAIEAEKRREEQERRDAIEAFHRELRRQRETVEKAEHDERREVWDEEKGTRKELGEERDFSKMAARKNQAFRERAEARAACAKIPNTLSFAKKIPPALPYVLGSVPVRIFGSDCTLQSTFESPEYMSDPKCRLEGNEISHADWKQLKSRFLGGTINVKLTDSLAEDSLCLVPRGTEKIADGGTTLISKGTEKMIAAVSLSGRDLSIMFVPDQGDVELVSRILQSICFVRRSLVNSDVKCDMSLQLKFEWPEEPRPEKVPYLKSSLETSTMIQMYPAVLILPPADANAKLIYAEGTGDCCLCPNLERVVMEDLKSWDEVVFSVEMGALRDTADSFCFSSKGPITVERNNVLHDGTLVGNIRVPSVLSFANNKTPRTVGMSTRTEIVLKDSATPAMIATMIRNFCFRNDSAELEASVREIRLGFTFPAQHLTTLVRVDIDVMGSDEPTVFEMGYPSVVEYEVPALPDEYLKMLTCPGSGSGGGAIQPPQPQPASMAASTSIMPNIASIMPNIASPFYPFSTTIVFDLDTADFQGGYLSLEISGRKKDCFLRLIPPAHSFVTLTQPNSPTAKHRIVSVDGEEVGTLIQNSPHLLNVKFGDSSIFALGEILRAVSFHSTVDEHVNRVLSLTFIAGRSPPVKQRFTIVKGSQHLVPINFQAFLLRKFSAAGGGSTASVDNLTASTSKNFSMRRAPIPHTLSSLVSLKGGKVWDGGFLLMEVLNGWENGVDKLSIKQDEVIVLQHLDAKLANKFANDFSVLGFHHRRHSTTPEAKGTKAFMNSKAFLKKKLLEKLKDVATEQHRLQDDVRLKQLQFVKSLFHMEFDQSVATSLRILQVNGQREGICLVYQGLLIIFFDSSKKQVDFGHQDECSTTTTASPRGGSGGDGTEEENEGSKKAQGVILRSHVQMILDRVQLHFHSQHEKKKMMRFACSDGTPHASVSFLEVNIVDGENEPSLRPPSPSLLSGSCIEAPQHVCFLPDSLKAKEARDDFKGSPIKQQSTTPAAEGELDFGSSSSTEEDFQLEEKPTNNEEQIVVEDVNGGRVQPITPENQHPERPPSVVAKKPSHVHHRDKIFQQGLSNFSHASYVRLFDDWALHVPAELPDITSATIEVVPFALGDPGGDQLGLVPATQQRAETPTSTLISLSGNVVMYGNNAIGTMKRDVPQNALGQSNLLFHVSSEFHLPQGDTTQSASSTGDLSLPLSVDVIQALFQVIGYTNLAHNIVTGKRMYRATLQLKTASGDEGREINLDLDGRPVQSANVHQASVDAVVMVKRCALYNPVRIPVMFGSSLEQQEEHRRGSVVPGHGGENSREECISEFLCPKIEVHLPKAGGVLPEDIPIKEGTLVVKIMMSTIQTITGSAKSPFDKTPTDEPLEWNSLPIAQSWATNPAAIAEMSSANFQPDEEDPDEQLFDGDWSLQLEDLPSRSYLLVNNILSLGDDYFGKAFVSRGGAQWKIHFDFLSKVSVARLEQLLRQFVVVCANRPTLQKYNGCCMQVAVSFERKNHPSAAIAVTVGVQHCASPPLATVGMEGSRNENKSDRMSSAVSTSSCVDEAEEELEVLRGNSLGTKLFPALAFGEKDPCFAQLFQTGLEKRNSGERGTKNRGVLEVVVSCRENAHRWEDLWTDPSSRRFSLNPSRLSSDRAPSSMFDSADCTAFDMQLDFIDIASPPKGNHTDTTVSPGSPQVAPHSPSIFSQETDLISSLQSKGLQIQLERQPDGIIVRFLNIPELILAATSAPSALKKDPATPASKSHHSKQQQQNTQKEESSAVIASMTTSEVIKAINSILQHITYFSPSKTSHRWNRNNYRPVTAFVQWVEETNPESSLLLSPEEQGDVRKEVQFQSPTRRQKPPGGRQIIATPSVADGGEPITSLVLFETVIMLRLLPCMSYLSQESGYHSLLPIGTTGKTMPCYSLPEKQTTPAEKHHGGRRTSFTPVPGMQNPPPASGTTTSAIIGSGGPLSKIISIHPKYFNASGGSATLTFRTLSTPASPLGVLPKLSFALNQSGAASFGLVMKKAKEREVRQLVPLQDLKIEGSLSGVECKDIFLSQVLEAQPNNPNARVGILVINVGATVATPCYHVQILKPPIDAALMEAQPMVVQAVTASASTYSTRQYIPVHVNNPVYWVHALMHCLLRGVQIDPGAAATTNASTTLSSGPFESSITTNPLQKKATANYSFECKVELKDASGVTSKEKIAFCKSS